jgi:integrase
MSPMIGEDYAAVHFDNPLRTGRIMDPVARPWSVSLEIVSLTGNRGAGRAGGVGKGRYETKALGAKADDILDADGEQILTFAQAQERLRERYAGGLPATKRATVGDALDRYKADLKVRKGDAGNVSRLRSHLPDALLRKALVDLEADELREWRDSLTEKLKDATVNRTTTVLGAALNHVADLDKRAAVNRQAWRSGLKALANADKADKPVNLPERIIRELIEAAAGEGPEFQLLVEVLAMTGTRYSQAARLTVVDLQDRRADPRVMMPASRKGRGEKKITHQPVPITPALAAKLRAVVRGRPMTEPLLLKADGEPWQRSNHVPLFSRTVKAAGLDAHITSYSLRHSHIIRQLLAGVPLRVCAALHDTSTTMLERVYSAHISDYADALARATLLDVSQPPPQLAVVR